MKIMETKSSEIVFFLGAGASVAAGVPDTYSFVHNYVESIHENSKRETIEKIISILKKWKRTEIDIELLLETLTKLKNKESEPLLQFFSNGIFLLKGYGEKAPLIDDLKDFIKSRAIVSEENINYLQPLLAVIEDFRPLDIISVNYDTSIEQFCNVHKLAYQDGFDVHWNPKTFNSEHTDIRLYKLHGSVMWYQTDRGDYIKIPIMTEESKIQLITGEKAENLMLYPMQKWDYAEPFLELSVGIKRLLESETCKYLIVIGYSLRDEQIIRILWDAARKNRDLHIILIDPKAYQIYHEKLQFYNRDRTNPSSLNGKVICLPYQFEKILPHLKNHYLINLKVGLSCEVAQHGAEISGQPPSWVFCLKNFIDAEFIDKVEAILKKDPLDVEKFPMQSLEFPLKMAINLCLGKEEKRAVYYFTIFCDRLKKIAIEKNHISINLFGKTPENLPNFQMSLEFNYQPNDQGGASYIHGEELIKFIENQLDFCQTRIEFAGESNNKTQNILNLLIEFKNHFKPFKEGKIGFGDYIRLRKKQLVDLDEVQKVYSKFQTVGLTPNEQKSFKAIFEDVERKILIEIIDSGRSLN
jgi:hypothetical protein